ncbi:STAS domain-containing protein [Vibrio sp. SCSIO 43136]|uniref:STAS domain-containing protein n=1 Tax=Vibrio sp. SCSIO 43136 TaxID=2819101 RepID=UPI002074AE09|nr:STAS domain-containing protein [Vibrio sp. SCSIO 43136]USD64255.1 STAS domain-containing protein [Vibrio sp. SCSIO 43136]
MLLNLPNELTIYEVSDLHVELLEVLQSLPESLVVDGTKVEAIDSAGVQLVIWLQTYCHQQSIDIELNKSEILQQWMQNLGVSQVDEGVR